MRAGKAALEASGDEKTYACSCVVRVLSARPRSLPRPLLALVMLQEFVLEMSAVLQLSPQIFEAAAAPK